MEWHQIVGFHHVAKTGSFTRAAAAAFRTQSALSQQIKALEDELGCLLFERIGRKKLRLTQCGAAFLEFAEEVLDRHALFRDHLNELKGLSGGPMTIAAPFTTLYHLFPQILREYLEQCPDVSLTILDRSQRTAVELVRNGEADFGFALETAIPGDLVALQWKKVETVIMAPKGHALAAERRVTLEQVAAHPLILPPKSPDHPHRLQLEALLLKRGIDCHVVMESSNVDLSSVYVEMGLGISFATIAADLPTLAKRQLEFISLSHYFSPDYLCIALRKNRSFTGYKRLFLDTLMGASSPTANLGHNG